MRPGFSSREGGVKVEVLVLGRGPLLFSSRFGSDYETCLVCPETVVDRLYVLFSLYRLFILIDKVVYNIKSLICSSLLYKIYILSIETAEGGDSDSVSKLGSASKPVAERSQ